MNGLEDLLRQALSETPTATSVTDPLDELGRRVRKARRRLAVGAGVAAAAVVAAVVVPLAMAGSGSRSGVQIGGHPTGTAHAGAGTDVWLDRNAHGVATADLRGHAFVVTEQGNGATRQLLELDGRGATVGSYKVPGSALLVAHRESALWVWGGGDGGYPNSEVTRLTVGSYDTAATASLGGGQAVRSLAITVGGDAWAVTTDQVVHLVYRAGAVRVVEHVSLAGAQRIVTTTEGELWVQADTRLVQLVPGGDPGGRTAQDSPVHWAGTLFGAGSGGSQPANRLWVQDGNQRVALFDPLAGPNGVVTSPITLPGRPTAVAEDGIGGLYVALAGGGVAFYDFAAVKTAGPPTARLPRSAVDVETMAATLDGGLLMQDVNGRLLHWKPPTS